MLPSSLTRFDGSKISGNWFRLKVLSRNFNAGSTFGDATQRTKLGSGGSINNVALHISLVTPADGHGDTSAHSAYTDEQYKSLGLAAQVLLW